MYDWTFCRYYGINDPVAEKLMRRASAMPKLEPPEDKSITTLYVGNLGDKLTEKELRWGIVLFLVSSLVYILCQG